MSRCYAYIVTYISRLEIDNVVLRPARLEVGHYDTQLGRGSEMSLWAQPLETHITDILAP